MIKLFRRPRHRMWVEVMAGRICFEVLGVCVRGGDAMLGGDSEL